MGGNAKMDDDMKQILNVIQSDFSLESRPFLKLANQLNITEEEVILSIAELKRLGYIRRLGGVFDSRNLGYRSVLCALSVPEDKIFEVAEMINTYHGVTHNYLRNHEYNMWFTLTAPTSTYLTNILEEIKIKTNIQEIMTLNALNTFKIKVNFKLKGEE